MDIRLREIQENDIKEINRIYNAAIDLGIATAHTSHRSIDYHKEWYQKHRLENNPILVATVDGKVIGWNSLSYYRAGREALQKVRETSYYVDEPFWNMGVATLLMTAIIEVAGNMEVKTLLSFIMDVNEASIHIMDKFGFKKWGCLPGIITHRERDCDHLIFGKKIV